MAIKEIGTNLEAYCMYSHARQEAGPSKTIHQIESAEFRPGPRTEEDIKALSWDDKKKGKSKAPVPWNNKCFNCGQDGHGIWDCHKLKNQCGKCKFHRGGH